MYYSVTDASHFAPWAMIQAKCLKRCSHKYPGNCSQLRLVDVDSKTHPWPRSHSTHSPKCHLLWSCTFCRKSKKATCKARKCTLLGARSFLSEIKKSGAEDTRRIPQAPALPSPERWSHQGQLPDTEKGEEAASGMIGSGRACSPKSD